MAHGWNSYYHNIPPLPSDPGTLRRTSDTEGILSRRIENFSGHHDFSNTVASNEAPLPKSNFNTNYCPNPSIANSSSDCVYQSYCNETQWQADGEQMEKDYLQRCANNDIRDFAADGLQTSGSYPSSFAPNIQGFKQDCGMLATSYMENYSDVSSCSDADAGETRSSCNFMASNSFQRPKTDVLADHGSSEWFLTHDGRMTYPNACPNISETDAILPSNVKARGNVVRCAQDKLESPQKISKSYAGHDHSSATSYTTTTNNETVHVQNDYSHCHGQKYKADVVRNLTQDKYSDISLSGLENLTEAGDRIGTYTDENAEEEEEEEQEITSAAPNTTTLDNEQDHRDQKILPKELFNPHYQGFDYLISTEGQARNMSEEEEDKGDVLKGERKVSGSLENVKNKFPIPNSTNCQEDCMEAENQEREILTNAAQSSNPPAFEPSNCKDTTPELTEITLRVPCTLRSDDDVASNLQLSEHLCDRSVAEENTGRSLAEMRDHNFSDASIPSLSESCLQPNSFSTDVKLCPDKELTCATKTNDDLSPDPNCCGPDHTSNCSFVENGEKRKQCLSSPVDSCLQSPSSSTIAIPNQDTELISEAGKTNLSAIPNQDTELISEAGKTNLSANPNQDTELISEAGKTNLSANPNQDTELISEAGKTNLTFPPDTDSRDSRVINDRLSRLSSDIEGQGVAIHVESCSQPNGSSTDIHPPQEIEMAKQPEEEPTTSSPNQDCSGTSVTTDGLSFDTNATDRQSVGSPPESCLQPVRSDTDKHPCLEKEQTAAAERARTTASPEPGCSSSALTSGIIKESVISSLESCLQANSSSTDIHSCSEMEWESPGECSNATSSSSQLPHKSPVADERESPIEDAAENAREFEEMDLSREEQSVPDTLYGEPLSREDSCDIDEAKLISSEYKETNVATCDGDNNVHPEGQEAQLKSSAQMKKLLHPVVILTSLESTNEVTDSYHCADCHHTTKTVDHLIEHHHSCHLMHDFQVCKTCNVYQMRTEEAEKHYCGVIKKRLRHSSDTSQQKKRNDFGRHKCIKCGLLFSKLTLFIKHMRTHTGKTPYCCDGCGLYFSQAGSMRRHKLIPGRCKKTKLSVLNTDTDDSEMETSSQEDVPQTNPYPNMPACYVKLVDMARTTLCGICSKSFPSVVKANKHRYSIHKIKSVAALLKQFTANDTEEKSHQVEKEMNEKYECPLCSRPFKYSYNRARHLRDCVREAMCGGRGKVGGKYTCPLCDAIFTLPQNRYRHVKGLCLQECLNRLAKEKEKATKMIKQQKLDNEQKMQPKENEQKEQALPTSTANMTIACEYRNSVFPLKSKLKSSKTPEEGENSLKSHEENSNSALSCHFCEKLFSSSKSLKNHQRNHRGERPYRCLVCSKGFKKRNHLIGHKIVHQKRIQCTVCKKILPTIGELIQHRKIHLKKGTLECPDCHLQFQYPVYLLRHLKTHRKRENQAPQLEVTIPLKPEQPLGSMEKQSGLKQLQCSLCKEEFDDAHILRKHSLTHISGSSSNQCPFCKRNFSGRRYLLRHMIKHTGDKTFSCTNCGRQFYRLMFLKEHSQKCLPPSTSNSQSDTKMKKLHKCSYCPRMFSKKSRLKGHHLAHKKNSLHLCSSCGQYFGPNKIKQHQNECKGTTELGTGLSSANGNFSKSISKTRNGVHETSFQSNVPKMLPFKCPHCTQMFRYRSLFFRHLVSHTGVQPYACKHCGHRYATQTMCLQHETLCDAIHKKGLPKPKGDAAAKELTATVPTPREPAQTPQAGGEAEYKCKFCTKTFMKPRYLRRHILTHNEVKPYRCKACDSCFSRYDHLKVHHARCKGKRKHLEVRIPKISLNDVGKGWQIRFGNKPAEKETFDCEVCSRSFPTLSKLSRHVTMFHTVKLYKCTRCSSSFSHEKSLKKHKKTNKCRKPSNVISASLPLATNPPADNVARPLEGMRNQIMQRIQPFFNKRPYPCTFCPRVFAKIWQLEIHNRLHTGEKPFSCNYCGERFIRKDYVKRHFAKCTKKQQQSKVLCDRCGGFFPESKIEDHKKICTLASGSSTSPAGQTQHSAAKSLPKGFSCAYCSSRFLLFSQLQEHFLSTHKLETMLPPESTAPLQQHLSNITKDSSDESGDEGLSDGSNLTCKLDSILESEVPQTFVCSDCNMSFTCKAGLMGHKRTHIGGNPFSCIICNKAFWNKTLLRNHRRKCKNVRIPTLQPEELLKAKLDSALNDSVLVFRESSETTGTGVLQTSFSCRDESMDESPQDSDETQEQSSSHKEKKEVQYQCSECDKSFTDGLMLISHLEDHGRQEQEKKRNTCLKCGRVCSNQVNLEKHMKMHGINKKHSCPECSKLFYTASDLEIHRTCHDPNRPYCCKLCFQRFWTRPSLCNHYGEEHIDDVYTCRFCSKTYAVKKSLTRHYKKWHQKEQKELENTVQEKSNSEQQPSSQVSTTGESDEDGNMGSEDTDSDSAPYFPCHVCGKTFPTSESLEDHQLCHLGEKPFECAECGKCFVQASQLQQHQRMHKSEFQCQTCGRGFVSLFALRKHKHTHGKSRPYRCSKCQLSFTSSSQLTEHMSTHREDNFPCDICNLVFLSQSSRAEHRKSHSKSDDLPPPSVSNADHEQLASHSESYLRLSTEFKYRCGVCCERFRDPEELSEHGCMEAKERPYFCNDCNKHFLHDSHLKKHRATHLPSWSNTEYPCNQCNRSFSSSELFLSHLKLHAEIALTIKQESDDEDVGPLPTFICPVCHQCFPTAPDLIDHFSTHPDGTSECEKITVPSGPKLGEHEDQPLTSATECECDCPDCGLRFWGSAALRQHHCSHEKQTIVETEHSKPSSQRTYQATGEEEEVDVTGEDLHNCSSCSMQFSSKSSLLEHQNIHHPDEKPFKCDICGKTFAKRRYLRKHEFRHGQKETPSKESQPEESKFKCTQCSTTFKTAQDLSLHMRLHAEKDVGEYRCDMCYKSFSQWSLLRQHQESHVGEVVYECTECDKAFAFPHLLEEHQQAHAGSSQ